MKLVFSELVVLRKQVKTLVSRKYTRRKELWKYYFSTPSSHIS